MKRVNQTARAKEEKGLEKRVRGQMKHAGAGIAEAQREDRVAELAQRGIGEDFFDVVLNDGEGRGKDGGDSPGPGNDIQGRRAGIKNKINAGQEKNTGCHHSRGVNERTDRGRSFHGIRKPNVERDLGGFSGDAEKNQERDRGHGRRRNEGCDQSFADQMKIERGHTGLGEKPKKEKNADHHAHVADARGEECLFTGGGGFGFLEPETDQKIRRKPHEFPENKNLDEIVGKHDAEHGKGEKRKAREKTAAIFIVPQKRGGKKEKGGSRYR